MADEQSSPSPSPAASNGSAVNYLDAFPALPASTPRTSTESAWASNIRPSQAVEAFTIPAEEQKVKGGQIIVKDIQRDTNTTIDFSMSKDKTLTVVITGKRKDIPQAKKLLLQKLQTQGEMEIAIPINHHKYIIGKQGAVLREMQDRHSVTIRVPNSESNSENVVIIGTTENMRKAAAEIQLLSDEKSKLDVIKLPILKAYHPLIAGCDNSTIKQIEADTGARVHVPPSSVESDEITVAGEKNGVHRAVQMLSNIYEEKKLTCGELTAQVKKSQHKYVIGNKGANLQEIMRTTGVVVEIPPSDSDSETIILRGPQQNLVLALTTVYEKANSIACLTIPIKGWLQKHVIGRQGANLKTLVANYPKVHVKFSEDADQAVIEGPTYEAELVKAGLETLAKQLEATLSHTDIKIDPNYHRHLIGRKGATIDKIKADSGAQITFPKPAEANATAANNNIVRVEGSPEAVKKAKEAIETIVAQLANSKTIDMIIDRKFHSSVIGPKGATISEIVTKFNGISINMPTANSDSEIVTLRGDRKDVDAAEAYIKKFLKGLEEEKYSIEVPIFRKFHANIIGKGGANIKKIREETNTQINVPKEDGSESDIITVIGRKKDCESARDKLLQIQGELANIEIEEITVDPKYFSSIIGPKGKVINGIMQELAVMIHFPQGADRTTRPDKVVVRGPKGAVGKARDRILQLAKESERNSQTETITVKQEYHGFLIGRSGAFLRQIETETGCRLVFPSSKASKSEELNEDTIMVVGRKENIEAAKKIVQEKVTQLENTIEETLEMEPKYFPFLLANRSQVLNELGNELGTTVTVPRSDSNQLRIKGLKEDVTKTIERLNQLVKEIQARVTIECQIAAEHFPAVMGAGGKNVRKITDDFKVQIEFPNKDGTAKKKKAPRVRGGKKKQQQQENGDAAAAAATDDAEEGEETEATTEGAEAPAADAAAAAAAAAGTEETAEGAGANGEVTMRPILISGQPEACEQAKAALLALVPIQETMEVPAEYHRLLIGTKGDDIRKLSDEANVRIKFPTKQGTNDNIITIKGMPQDIAKARELIKARMVELEDVLKKNFRLEVTIDPVHHKQIIGARGATINEIRQQFGVNIEMPKPNATNNSTVVIIGYEKDTLLAKDEILRRVQEWSSFVTLEVDIDPRVRPRIIGGGGRGMRDIMTEFNVRITFPRENPEDPVLIVGLPDDAESCKEKLLLLQDDFMQSVTEREELQRHVKQTPKEDKPKKQQDSFMLVNAPWDSQDQSAFPSLGGQQGKSGPLGAWANARR